MGEIVRSARVPGDCHLQAPFSTHIAGLLLKLSPRSLLRSLTLLHHPGTNLMACASKTIAILPLHHKFPIFRNGYHIHPVRIFQHIKFRINSPVRQLHFIMTHPKPRRTRHYNLTFEGLPPPAVVSSLFSIANFFYFLNVSPSGFIPPSRCI